MQAKPVRQYIPMDSDRIVLVLCHLFLVVLVSLEN